MATSPAPDFRLSENGKDDGAPRAFRIAGAALGQFRGALTLVTSQPRRLVVLAVGVAFMLLALNGFILTRDRDSELAPKGPTEATTAKLVQSTSVGADQLLTVGDQAKRINASLPLSKAPIEAAETFNLASDALDYSPALLCLASAVYHEAGFEPLSGRRAVAQVVLNRLRHPAFPKSVCGVVFQGAGSPVCQFSFACDGSQLRAPAAHAWRQSVNVAAAALAGHIEASVGMATHYHADYVAPRWAPLLPKIAQIGTHIFYRWPGDWGRRPAFRGRYRGENGTPLHHVNVPAVELAAIEAMKTGKVRAVGVLEIDNGETSALMVHADRNGTNHLLDAGDVPLPPSTGKAITVTLIARLVERGALEWDAPLKQLLPDLVATMRPEYQEVTLIELLSHRSGLPDGTNSKFLQSFRDDTRSLPDQRRAYLERALTEAPAGKRGSYTYSGTGFLAAAAAAERVTEQSFEELVIEEIFRPLKMRSAELGVSKEGQSVRYGGKKLFPPSSGELPRLWAPVSGVPMSLADFGKFLLDQMHGERGKGKLLKSKTYRFIHLRAPGSAASERAGFGWTLHNEPFGRHLMDTAADGSVATGIMMAPGKLDAVVVVADGKDGEPAISRALAAVRASWVRQRRSR